MNSMVMFRYVKHYQRVVIPATPSATHPATHLGPGHTAGARQLHRPAIAATAVEPEIDAAAADAFAWSAGLGRAVLSAAGPEKKGISHGDPLGNYNNMEKHHF